jgi:RNA polymerase sigma-70 factor, ECF subfamily
VSEWPSSPGVNRPRRSRRWATRGWSSWRGAGDQHAFEALVQRHHRRLLARVQRVLPPDHAEDALQNGLLNAWLALQRGTEIQDARPWLERIVHNAALRMLPSRNHTELTDTIARTGEHDPAAMLDRRQQLHDALTALASLPELQRDALVQTALEGESYASAARSLGLTQSTVRGLVYRARTAMRNALGALIPLPGLGRLLGRRPSVAQRAGAAAHAGTTAAPGGVGAIVAKGALVLAVAAGGVGAAQVIPGRSTTPTTAHHARHTPAPLGPRGHGAPARPADRHPNRAKRHGHARAVVRRASARRASPRVGSAATAPRAHGTISLTGRRPASGGPSNAPGRGSASQASPTAQPGPIRLTAGTSPTSVHSAPAPPPQGGGAPPSTTTSSSQPPPTRRRARPPEAALTAAAIRPVPTRPPPAPTRPPPAPTPPPPVTLRARRVEREPEETGSCAKPPAPRATAVLARRHITRAPIATPDPAAPKRRYAARSEAERNRVEWLRKSPHRSPLRAATASRFTEYA